MVEGPDNSMINTDRAGNGPVYQAVKRKDSVGVSVYECYDESNYKKMTAKCQETVLMAHCSTLDQS